MKSSKQQVFAELMADRANRLCVDCSTPNPQWASVSHGSFLCIKCAGVHRSLGVHISFVRSITMDSWSPLQLEKMKAGGNARFLAYLQKQKFPKNLPHEQKYDSKACENYREHILGVSRGESAKDLPFVGYERKAQRDSEDIQASGRSRKQRHGSSGTRSAASSSNGYGQSRSGGPVMIGFGSDGGASSQPQDSTWSWDNISSALKSAATSVADTSKVAANIVAEKSRTAAKSAQSLTSESDVTSTFSQQANAGWGALRSAMSGAAASARSMIGEEEPVRLYRHDDVERSSRNHTSSSSGYSSKSLSSEAYFGSGQQIASSGMGGQSRKSRSSAEASLDAFFSDSPANESDANQGSVEVAKKDDEDGFSWGFNDSNTTDESCKPQLQLSNKSSDSKIRASKTKKTQQRASTEEQWGFGDNDSDDNVPITKDRTVKSSIDKSRNVHDANDGDDTWDEWD